MKNNECHQCGLKIEKGFKRAQCKCGSTLCRKCAALSCKDCTIIAEEKALVLDYFKEKYTESVLT